jgi:hypothetical protein
MIESLQYCEEQVVSHCSPKAILTLLDKDIEEAVYRLRLQAEQKDFRFTQGELNILHRYKELLTKAIS